MKKNPTFLFLFFSFFLFSQFNLLNAQCTNVGGDLTTVDGETELFICAGDGVSDAFDVTLTNAQGSNSVWIITDKDGKIVSFPFKPPFDFEGAGNGICLLYHLSFEDGVQGIIRGQNINDLEGCHDLSNPITVNRTGVDGGKLTTADGLRIIDICAGDGVSDAFDVNLSGTRGANSAWVITDDKGNILGLPPGPPFDLEGAGEGVCLIWHLSFEDGLTGAEVGNNASDLEGCFDLSNPIRVNRTGVDGGELTTADGETEITICAGDGISDAFNVSLSGELGSNSAWVITDTAGNILGLPAAPPFDLEGAGEGICLLWHLSFEDGLEGAAVGNNASDLSGCFDLSNPVTVNRTGIKGGELSTTDGETEITICAGDGEPDSIDVTITGNQGSNTAWVITDADGNILDLPASPPFDFEGAGGGVCLIWHLSFEDGLSGAEIGNNASDLEGCFQLSNPVTVNRIGMNGGTLTTADGQTEIFTCAGDGTSDAFDVILTDASGPNSAWIITDINGKIVGFPFKPPFDFEGAGNGVCLVYHISFVNGVQGIVRGKNINDIEGCHDISNPITVNRNKGSGGDISFADGSTEATVCVGKGNSESLDVVAENIVGSNFAWVITDADGNILALPDAPPFSFEDAGPGVCLIWGLSFEDGLSGAEVGMNANDLEGCFNLSNPLTVNRIEIEGGTITTADSLTELSICAGDGVSDAFDVILEGNTGSNSAWVITDADGNILALPAGPPFDLEPAGDGVCLVWHLSFEDGLEGAEVGMNANDLVGCFDLSNPITVTRTGVDGGAIATTDSLTELTICAGDGVSDAFDVTLEGNIGSNSAWVITDADGNILDLPAGPPFDLEGAGDGVCLIWHLSFEDGLEGAAVGNNAADLVGCFDLSNPITVTRTGVDGGTLTTTDSLTEITICAGDGVSDAFDVILEGNTGSNSAWVVTDTAGNILALPDAPPFDLDPAGPGVCLVWHLSFEDGLEGAAVGNNAADLSGCFDLSNPITVIRTSAEGGMIMTTDSLTELTICAGDGVSDAFDVVLEGNSGANFAWVITDADGNILDLPAGPPFDLEGAGDGVCLIWHLSFADGLQGAEVGNNAADLVGCFDLSNPITVTRTGVDGGTLTTTDSLTEITICAGDGVSDAFDVILEGNTGSNSAWVVTDTAGNILALPDAPPFDLDPAGPGICLVWHLSFEDGLEGAAVGNNAADLSGCFDLSNPITVIRTSAEGGMIMTTDSLTEITICAGDGVSDAFDVILEGNSGANSAWVITDADGNILDLPAGPPFDLEGAGDGVCLIWHLSFADGLQGAEVGNNAADLSGCFDLSNPITVNRNGVDGGMLSTADSLTVITICAGDGVSDAFDVILEGNTGSNSAWVVTDTAGNILALPDAPPFDLDPAGPGVCLVWHLSFEDGLEGAAVGSNAADLVGCFDLSNPITVIRTSAEGGMIMTTDSLTELTICAGDGVSDAFDVVLEGNSGANSAWVITDADGNILDLPAGPPFDLEGAGDGVCLIWHLSFADGLQGAEVGNNAADLVGCFDLSNPITVNRNGVDGGMLTTANGLTELEICAGDGLSDAFDVILEGNIGTNSAWVITDTTGNILALPEAPPFDLDPAGPGICLIWHLSFEDGLEGAAVGNNAADLSGCFDLSNPITVTRTAVAGGTLTTTDSLTELSICAGDGMSDAFDVILEGNMGTNSAWVITDADGNILDLPAAPPFDLEGAGDGVCLIWHLSFEDGIQGAEVGNNAADLVGCFALSNPITVNRIGVDGGMVMTTDSLTRVNICVGNNIPDSIAFTGTSTLGNFAFVVTDTNNVILGLPPGNVVEFDGAGPGICRVWGLSFTGNLTAAVDDTASAIALSDECFALSSNFVEVVRDTSGEVCNIPLIDLGSDFDPGIAALIPYPNPAHNQIRIDINLSMEAENLQLEIYDLFGRQVFSKDLGNQIGRLSEDVDISNWAEGTYLINLRTKYWVKPYRFVKN